MTTRLDSVRDLFAGWGVDALLITSAANRRWLSGFTGSAGQLLITRDRAIMATDSRYWTRLSLEAPSVELFSLRSEPDEMARFLQQGGATRIGIEGSLMSVAEFRRLERIDGFEWVALDSTVEQLREIKSADELALMASAAKVTDLAAELVPSLVRVGMTESQLAWVLEKTMREAGADAMAFEIIIASGPNSALPHHHPGDRQLQPGDPLIVDMGAALLGYKSDLTRSFYLGAEAPDEYWAIYNTVLAAHTAAMDHLRGGMTGKEGDALARDVIAEAGYGDRFGHGLGHGVGLEIHEGPRLARTREKDPVPTGSVVTIEPGIYIPGYGGVRIEDMVLVTDGGVQSISHAAKLPLIPIS